MLTIKLQALNHTLITIAVLCAFVIPTDSRVALADRYDPAEQGNCAFSLQLASDHYARTQYLMQLNEAIKTTTANGNDPAAMYGVIVPASTSNGPDVRIDSFSFDCIVCHDGMNAPSHELRFKNDPQNRVIDIASVRGSHPIGMHYASYTYVNRELRNIQQLDPGMIFVDGKVGCLSCHNPLNPAKKHLVMSNDYSNLCFSCHNK